ncbi:MAG TPA: hypothetical protein VJ722_08700 [Rhodanobacteraceae bacterium]|nr:hypothetical protein [Rhodanobacteraceae bacterium]
MPHALAGALKQAGRIGKRRSVEEPDIHMYTERVDVPERRVLHARDGMPVIHKLADIRSATAHLFEPRPRELPQRIVGFEPRVNPRFATDGARKAQNPVLMFRLQGMELLLRIGRETIQAPHHGYAAIAYTRRLPST